MKKQEITYVAGAALLACVYMLFVATWISILYSIVPLVFIIIGLKFEIRTSIVSLLATALVLTGFDMFSGIYVNLIILLSYVAPISLWLVYAMKKNKNSKETVIAGTIIVILIFAILVTVFDDGSIKFTEDKILLINQFISETVDQTMTGNYTTTELQGVKDMMQIAFRNFLVVLPGVFLSIAFFSVMLNYYLAIKLARSLMPNRGFRNVMFRNFELPRNMVLGIIISGAILMLFKMFKVDYGETFWKSTIFIISTAFSLQGLAVLDYLMARGNRIGYLGRVVLIIIAGMFLAGVMVFIGVLESLFRFRNRAKDSV